MATNVAFEILYREYYVRVFGLCRQLLGSTPLAEDAAQETFMRAYRHFDRYDTTLPFWQWIATIANRYCIDVLRKRSRSGALFDEEQFELDQVSSDTPSPLIQVLGEQDASVLSGAISALPDKYRVPIVLAYFHDASYDEIAEDLAISRNHVGVLLLRAKQQLRKSLEKGAMP
ncbi:MAG: sigma-70 family RNA polymerase sigma factor [Pseudomonadales bacterium]|nr:sigma-70 family RNA polymerase sigma factor [Pseudomonadales bacterium]MBO6564245.1 sigma-70 family RNA polymerase sigma factor [Pseudomonadales bacterium]MBO6597070.1 sigma-70 family RNA polymerase sigma factor [Pseudomonadales bacterium]MBO6656114.1 sigma-70 family RNA polymerase sigma factor [Pseudomonadales bacterium]MBO6703713.1 sigma-70 family RNA polymerase sigma factor [Pseudomonadales bacterium]